MPETAQATEDTAVESQQNNEMRGIQAQSVEFPEATDSATSGQTSSIDALLDMDVPVTVVIGHTELPVQKLLQLRPGSVVKLDKSVDAPVDLYLKNTRFATGNIVVVENRFAVKIKEILGTSQTANAKK